MNSVIFKNSSVSLIARTCVIAIFSLIAGSKLYAVEQQLVVHWKSSTSADATDLLKDRNGNLLDRGLAANKDGCIVTLGYFKDAIASGIDDDLFEGEWVPLTTGTAVGDSSSGYGYGNGMFSFTTVFTIGSDSVMVYPNEPAGYQVQSPQVITTNIPPPNHPIAIRFYDRNVADVSAKHNTVSSVNWKWPSVSGAIPSNLYIKASSGTAVASSKWIYGNTFEGPLAPFQTVLGTMATLGISATVGGTVNDADANGTYNYGQEVTIQATPTGSMEFVRWDGDGVAEPTFQNTTVSMTNPRVLKAIFQLAHHNLTLTTSGGGDLSGSGSFEHGSAPSITATPHSGYAFVGWQGIAGAADGLVDSSLTTTSVQSLDQDRSYVAVFHLKEYISAAIEGNSTYGGHIDLQSGPYVHFSPYFLNATPWRGYSFLNWTSETNSTDDLSSISEANATLTVKGPAQFTANFQENQYDLTVSTIKGGTVTPEVTGSYLFSEVVPVVASPEPGYQFSHWTGDLQALENLQSSSTDANMSKKAGAVNLQAHFAPKTYSVEVNASAGGRIELASGPYEHFGVYTIKATPDLGYTFIGWQGGTSSLQSLLDADSNSTQLVVSNPIGLTANFSLNNYNLSVSAATGGIAQGSGTYPSNETPTITAIPSAGYRFSHWGEDNNTLNVATATTTSVDMAKLGRNIELTAIFLKKSYTITAQVSGQGKVEGVDSLSRDQSHFDQMFLTASPSSGWSFDNWSWTGSAILSDATLPSASFTVKGSSSLTANFSRSSYQLSIQNVDQGIANGGGIYLFESNATITASPAYGYIFSHWSGDIATISNPNTSTATLSIPDHNSTLTPIFSPVSHDLTVSHSGNGSVSGSGSFPHATTVTITATPNGSDATVAPRGYFFKKWEQNDLFGSKVSSETPYTFTINSDTSIIATFEPIPPNSYSLETRKNIDAAGTTSGDGYFDEDTNRLITATPNTGYTFLGWVSEDPATLTFTPNDGNSSAWVNLDGNTTVKAYFVENVRKLEITHGTGGTTADIGIGTNKSLGTFSHGHSVLLTAIPDANHSFARWNIEKNITYNVTLGSKAHSSGTTFHIDGRERPEIVLVRGFTYIFNINTATNFPFYLSTLSESSSAFEGEYNEGVTGNRITQGALTFTVPANSPDLLYYHSPNNSSMGSPLRIISLTDSQILQDANATTNTVTLLADLKLSATFGLKDHQLTVEVTDGGSLQDDPTGEYAHGSIINITANQPDEHYSFLNWQGPGIADARALSTTIEMVGDRVAKALYGKKSYPLHIQSNSPKLGVANVRSGNLEFAYNTEANLIATPNPGSYFTHWTGTMVSDRFAPETSLIIKEDANVTAHFQSDIYQLDVSRTTLNQDGTPNTDPDTGGTTVTGNAYAYGAKATVRAIASPGHEFVEWKNNNTISYDVSVSRALSTSGCFQIKDQERPGLLLLPGYTYQFKMDGISTLGHKLYFSEKPDSDSPYSKGVSSNPTDSGVISLTISSSTPKKLYYGALNRAGFGNAIQIYDDDSSHHQEFEADKKITTVTMISDKSVTAVFKSQIHPINYQTVPAYGGSVALEGDSPSAHGSTITLTATPAAGFKFESWSGNGLLPYEQSNPKLSRLVTEPVEVIARFVQTGTISVNLNVSPIGAGWATGSGRYGHTPSHPITASPNLGYSFKHWEGTGVPEDQRNQKSTTIDLNSDAILTAVFERIDNIQHAVNVTISPSEGGRVNGGGYFETNPEHRISAVPNDGYQFAGWQGEGIANSKAISTTLSLTTDRTISLLFTKIASETNNSSSDLLAEALSNFDPIAYLDRNTDLKSTYKDNLDQAFNHFVNQGFAEGRPYKPDPSASQSQPASPPSSQPKTMEKALEVFDPVVYLSLNPDLFSVYGTNLGKAKDHFIEYGFELGRAFVPATFNPSATAIPAHGFISLDHALEAFEAAEYLALNPIVSSILGSNNLTEAKSHFIQYGFQNGLGFSTTATASNTATPDPSLPSLEQALSDFDPLNYLKVNYAIHEAIGNDLDGATERFIANWEENREAAYKDSSESKSLGGKLPEDMSLDQALKMFDPSNYLAANTDIASTLGNDLKTAEKHFIDHGYEQGREFRSAEQKETVDSTPSTSTRTLSEVLSNFDPNMYLALNPDLKTTIGDNPEKLKEHFVEWGNKAGRPTQPEDLSSGFTDDGTNTENQDAFTLRLTVFPDGAGSVNGGGEFAKSSSPSIEARANSGYIFTEWQGDGITDSSSPSTTVSLTANREIFAVFRYIGTGEELPIARIPGSHYIGWDWWTTEWFGSYWHQTRTQWVFHEKLGWVFLVPYSEDSVWMWVDYLGGWHWTAKDIYPFLHDYNTSTWLWFDSAKPRTNGTRMFFRYLSGQTTGNWESR